MDTKKFEKIALSFFSPDTLTFFNDGTQYGFNNYLDKDIKRMGYSVNLTMDIINQAKKKNVELILTHHNVWEDDHFEMREDCLQLLKKYGIIHFFNHLPLDTSDFGPTYALAKDLKLKIIGRIAKMDDFYFGVVGECSPQSLSEFKDKVEKVLYHQVRVWENNNREVKRIGIVSGSGKDLASLHEAHLYKCDAYLTGEKSLSTLLYAKHVGLNFILGSHTFTELGGIRNYAKMIQDKNDIEIIELVEEWME